MTSIREKITSDWHPMRWIALGAGLFFGIQAIANSDGLTGLFSVFFLYQAITNSGCFGAAGCKAPQQVDDAVNRKEFDEIEFTEIK